MAGARPGRATAVGAKGGPVRLGAYCPHTPTLFEEELHVPTRRALTRVAPLCEGVDAVVVASPHWVGRGRFLVQASARPRCIQDYYGFPERYYDFRYEPPGHPELAAAIAAEARRAGLPAEATEAWGLDHGHWVPLLFLRPEAATPVVGLSIATLSLEDHRRFGEAVRHAAVATGLTLAVVGTGSPGHRLDRVTWGRHGPYPEGEEFDRRLIEALTHGHPEEIAAMEPRLWEAAAPEGFLAPLFVLLGALGWDGGRTVIPPRVPPTQEAPAAGPQRAELVAYERAFTAVSLATLLFRAA